MQIFSSQFAAHKKLRRLNRLRKKFFLPSFRAKRGIPLRFKSKKRGIPHPQERVRNDDVFSFFAACSACATGNQGAPCALSFSVLLAPALPLNLESPGKSARAW